MLRIPELNDVSYEELVERAIGKIPQMTAEWTDFNDHDPGITILQTYAWLMDLLNYYMNATGDAHLLSYLKLLDIKPVHAQAAKAFLQISGGTEGELLRRGQKFLAGDLVFELQQDYRICENHMIACLSEVDGKKLDLTAFAGVDGDYADVFAPQPHTSAVYFGFSKALRGAFTIQLTIEPVPGRNAPEPGFSLGSFVWQWKSAEGFVDMEPVRDETCGLMQSGLLHFEIPGETQADCFTDVQGERLPEGHYIRCILKENEFEMLPRIGSVCVNPILVEQKETLAGQEELLLNGRGSYEIPGWCEADSRCIAAVELQNNEYVLVADTAGELENSGGVQLRKMEGSGRWSLQVEPQVEQMGQRMLLYILSPATKGDNFCAKSNGCASQRHAFSYPGLYEIGVTTFYQKDGMTCCRNWKQVEQLSAWGDEDYVFCYQQKEQRICFGDGIHGVIPEQGELIAVTQLAISAGAAGNVREHSIRRLRGEERGDLKPWNAQPAAGGLSEETVEAAIERMKTEILQQNRMVQVQDYIDTVSRTPGLFIDSVSVIPGRIYGDYYGQECTGHEVILAVKPFGSVQNRPVLSDFYREKIKSYIEEKRLLNTKVTIVSPSYVGIELHCRIRLLRDTPENRDGIETFLAAAVGNQRQKISIGKLRMELETRPEVGEVPELSLERIGRGGRKTEQGDILLFEDAISYVRKLEVKY